MSRKNEHQINIFDKIQQLIDEVEKEENNTSNVAADGDADNEKDKDSVSWPNIINLQKDMDSEKVLYNDDVAKLKHKKGVQNLQERKTLLILLGVFFAVQLISMNLFVGFLIFWTTCDISWLREMDFELLSIMTSFMKFYISAILVEILGGIIFITHKVYTEKIT